MNLLMFLLGAVSGIIAGVFLDMQVTKWRQSDDALDELSRAVIAEEQRKWFSAMGYLDGDGQDEYIVVGRQPYGPGETP